MYCQGHHTQNVHIEQIAILGRTNETERDFSRLLWKQFRGKLEDLRFLRFPAPHRLSTVIRTRRWFNWYSPDHQDRPLIICGQHQAWCLRKCVTMLSQCCHVICHVSWQSTIPGQISHGAIETGTEMSSGQCPGVEIGWGGNSPITQHSCLLYCLWCSPRWQEKQTPFTVTVAVHWAVWPGLQ